MKRFYTYRVGGVRHVGLASKGRRYLEVIFVSRSAYGQPGLGLCILQRGEWRNRWVFFGGRRLLGFVGW